MRGKAGEFVIRQLLGTVVEGKPVSCEVLRGEQAAIPNRKQEAAGGHGPIQGTGIQQVLEGLWVFYRAALDRVYSVLLRTRIKFLYRG